MNKDFLDKKVVITFLFGMFISLFSFYVNAESSSNNKEVEFAVFSMNNDIPALSKSKARMLYKGKTKKINGSLKIILVDLPVNSIHREEFYSMLLGKSISQMNGYWASLSFSGKGKAPEELNSDDIKSIIEWLNNNPNGIAYAPIESVPENANILITVLQGE